MNPLVFTTTTLVDPLTTGIISFAFGVEGLPKTNVWIGGFVVITGVATLTVGEHWKTSSKKPLEESSSSSSPSPPFSDDNEDMEAAREMPADRHGHIKSPLSSLLSIEMKQSHSRDDSNDSSKSPSSVQCTGSSDIQKIKDNLHLLEKEEFEIGNAVLLNQFCRRSIISNYTLLILLILPESMLFVLL